MNILKYLRKTMNYGMIYYRDRNANSEHPSPMLVACTDSSFGGDADGISVSGFIIQVVDRKSYLPEDTEYFRSKLLLPRGNVIDYGSNRQREVTDSSKYSEYIALHSCVNKTIHKRQIMSELGFVQTDHLGTIVFIDNSSAIRIVNTWKIGGRSKHINAKYHVIRQFVIRDQTIDVRKIPTLDNGSDMNTKPLSRIPFEKHRNDYMTGTDHIEYVPRLKKDRKIISK